MINPEFFWVDDDVDDDDDDPCIHISICQCIIHRIGRWENLHRKPLRI